MLEAMQRITLLDLQEEFDLPIEKNCSLSEIRQTYPSELNELLVEASEKIERVYILSPTSDSSTVQMTVSDIKDAKRLPFNKPTGSQSPAIGPVIKRTFTDKKSGPSRKIQDSTQKAFEEISKENKPWSNYFKEIINILSAGKLLFNDQTIELGEGKTFPSVLAAAIDIIPEKETVFLTIANKEDQWPGDCSEYRNYLAQALASEKYLTKETPAKEDGQCFLCGESNISLYPNGLKGAGLNLFNVDREGAFPSLKKAWSWKSYALCLNCADSLYIFKNHLMKNFITRIAGSKCLVIPDLIGDKETQFYFIKDFKKYIKASQATISSHELDLLDFFKDQTGSSLILHIVWAVFGQAVDDISGVVMEILPSQLNKLSRINRDINQNHWQHALAPTSFLEEMEFDLELNFLHRLFERPGGKKVEKLNDSVRLFEIKRSLASAIYRGEKLDKSTLDVFWKEILETAKCYLDQVNHSGFYLGLIQEKTGDKPSKYLTLSSWVRHLARFLAYLSIVEVHFMEEMQLFEPEMAVLKPYFAKGSGIDSLEKGFAFLLGALFGKLVQVQAAKGVNVSSNSLTWLKRLNLTGRDLPELYIKIREKLLAYETEGSPDIQLILQEIGHLGVKLGNKIQLDNISTCYFLLLGQSMTTTILPTKEKK